MKKFNRIAALLLALVLTFSLLPVVHAEGFGEASYDVISQNDPNNNNFTGAAADDGKIDAGEMFKLTLTWDGNDFEPGGTYTFTTKKGFVLYTSDFNSKSFSNGVLQDNNHTVNGSFSFSYNAADDNSTVTISFDNSYNDFASGKLELYGKFDNPQNADGDDDDDIIEIPGDGEYPIYKPDAPGQTYEIYADKGSSRRDVDGKIYLDYHINISAVNGTLTDVVITDRPDETVTMVTENARVTDGIYSYSVVCEPVTVNNGDGTYSWTIPEIPDGHTYTLRYTVCIENPTIVDFYNYAEIESAQGTSTYVSCTTSLNKPNVKKTGSLTGNRVTWTINVTFNDFDSVVVRDYDVSYYFNDKGIKVTLTPDDAVVTITYEDGSITETTYGQLSSGYNLQSNGNAYATLTFTSILPDDYASDHSVIENTAWVNVGNSNSQDTATVPITVRDRIVSKTGDDQAAYKNPFDTYQGEPIYHGGGPARIHYEIKLSFEDAPANLYTTPKFYDYISDTHDDMSHAVRAGMRYDVSSFKLVHGGTTYTAADNWGGYVESWQLVDTTQDSWLFNASYKNGISGTSAFNALQSSKFGGCCFAIEFSDSAPDGDYTLLYDTTYDPTNYTGGFMSDTLYNYFVAPNYEFAEAKTPYVLNYIYKGVKKVDGNKVTWDVSFPDNQYLGSSLYSSVRYNGYFDTNGNHIVDPIGLTITDTLPEGFTLNSVRLYNEGYYGDPVDIEIKPYASEDQPYYYTYDEATNVLSVVFNGYMSNPLIYIYSHLEIETTYDDYDKLTPGKTSKAFTNEAQLTVNGITYPKVSAQTTFTPPKLITKSMSYIRENAPRPQFTIEVNPDGQDMMKDSDTITVRDVILDTNQTFLANTLNVYNGIGAGKTLVNKSEYQVDVSANEREFIITGLKDATAYTIQYNTHVDVAYDSTEKFDLINRAYLDGVKRDLNGDGKIDADEIVYAECKWHDNVVIPSAINNLSYDLPPVFVEKTDAITGNWIAGAVFTIYDESGNVVHTITSTEEGLSNGYQIGKIGHTYTMKETTAPEGYALSDSVWKFGRFLAGYTCPPGVDNLDGMPLKIYRIENIPEIKETSVTIHKDGGQFGENFIMNVAATNANGDSVQMKVVVPANGSVTIDGLMVDTNVTVTEDSSWAWRYTIGNPGAITLDIDPAKNQVTVTNSDRNNKWLSGDSIANNWFGRVITPDDGQE